jgi:stage III sporulation protein AA
VGQTTDVLDGCPKTEGILMAVRALSPEVIVTDEVGAPGDAEALAEAARAGVTVLASAHGRCAEDLYRRVLLRPLLEGDAVERILVLERTGGVRRVRMEIPGERMRTCARF